jgi:hypothetical protein
MSNIASQAPTLTKTGRWPWDAIRVLACGAGLLACLVALPSPAHAFGNMADTAINNMMLGTHIPPMNQALMTGVLDEQASSGHSAGDRSAEDHSTNFSAQSSAPLTIRRIASGPLESIQEELAATMAADEATRVQILQGLRSGVVAAEFDELLRYNQMDPTDLADGLTAYTVIMWLVANDQLDGQSDPARLRAVSDQIGPMFRSTPELQALSPEQRAVEYERIAALSLYAIAAYTKFDQEGDRAAKTQLQSAVQESMQHVGWDLTALDLTHRGFEPRP